MSTTKNLHDSQGIKKLQEMAKEIDICLFCTDLNGDGSTARPMSTQGVDDNGDIWFFSAKDSDKNREVQQDSRVQLIYAHPPKSSFLVVNGEATVEYDRQKIHELWKPHAKAWFTEGEDDPTLSLIRVKVNSAHYWDVKGNKMINFFKMIASMATGKELIDAEEGNIKP